MGVRGASSPRCDTSRLGCADRRWPQCPNPEYQVLFFHYIVKGNASRNSFRRCWRSDDEGKCIDFSRDADSLWEWLQGVIIQGKHESDWAKGARTLAQQPCRIIQSNCHHKRDCLPSFGGYMHIGNSQRAGLIGEEKFATPSLR